MRTTVVRHCGCGHFFVGDHDCPSCKAPWLTTRLVMRVRSRKLARMISADLRHLPDRLTWYKERYHINEEKA